MEPCAGTEIICVPDLKLEPECSFENFDFEVCNYVKEYHFVITSLSGEDPILDGLYPLLFIRDNKYNLF